MWLAVIHLPLRVKTDDFESIAEKRSPNCATRNRPTQCRSTLHPNWPTMQHLAGNGMSIRIYDCENAQYDCLEQGFEAET